MILFTDGVVGTGNPVKDGERSRWLQDSLAAQAKQLGVRIFGIAFTEGADFRLLQSVAQTTGGEHYRVLTPADIGGVFERVLSRIQELADQEARRAAEAKAAADKASRLAAPAPPMSPAPAPGAPWGWGWVLGLVLAAGAVALAFWIVRSRPAVTGCLRDVGRYTGQELYPLRGKLTRIGRDPKKNDVVIPQDTVSSQHAQIEIRGTTFYLKDLRSGNGSFVNGKKISDADEIREPPLKHGDRLRFDAFEFEFEFAVDGLAAAPAALSGAPVTPGGTRLRPVAPGCARLRPAAAGTPRPQAAVSPPMPPARVVAAADAIALTRLKTGKCNVHTAWDAVAVCPQCGYEKCQQCMTQKSGMDLCIDCATAPAA
ncbi:MAG: FHA domain-containing protein [Burkholderiales bacterium]